MAYTVYAYQLRISFLEFDSYTIVLTSMTLAPSVAKPLSCETGRSLSSITLRTVSTTASQLHESNSSKRFLIAKNFTSGHPDEFTY